MTRSLPGEERRQHERDEQRPLLGCRAHATPVDHASTIDPVAVDSEPATASIPVSVRDDSSGTAAEGVRTICDVATSCHACLVEDVRDLVTRVCEQFDSPRANPHSRRLACMLPALADDAMTTVLAYERA